LGDNSPTSRSHYTSKIMRDDRAAKKILKQMSKLGNSRVGKSWPAGDGTSSFSSEEGVIKVKGSVRGRAIALKSPDGSWNALSLEPEESINTNVVINNRNRPKPEGTKFIFAIGFGGVRYPDKN